MNWLFSVAPLLPESAKGNSSTWATVLVAGIGTLGLVIVEMLRRSNNKSTAAATQAAINAELVRLDSVKYAALQTKEHATVANLLKQSIQNDERLGRQIEGIQFDTHEIRIKLREHCDSTDPHPNMKQRETI